MDGQASGIHLYVLQKTDTCIMNDIYLYTVSTYEVPKYPQLLNLMFVIADSFFFKYKDRYTWIP